MISADSPTFHPVAIQSVAGTHPDLPIAAAPTPPINNHVQIWMAMMDAATKTADAILDLQAAHVPVPPA